MNSPIINKVTGFAKTKHCGQKRKSGESYIIHLIETGNFSRKIAEDMIVQYPHLKAELDDIHCAGILHDIIEDTDTNYDEIVKISNEHVAKWVSVLSDDKRLPSKIRHELYGSILASACIEVKILKLADIYSNIIGIKGNENILWIKQFLNKSEKGLKNIKDGVGNHPFFAQTIRTIRKIKNNNYSVL